MPPRPPTHLPIPLLRLSSPGRFFFVPSRLANFATPSLLTTFSTKFILFFLFFLPPYFLAVHNTTYAGEETQHRTRYNETNRRNIVFVSDCRRPRRRTPQLSLPTAASASDGAAASYRSFSLAPTTALYSATADAFLINLSARRL